MGRKKKKKRAANAPESNGDPNVATGEEPTSLFPDAAPIQRSFLVDSAPRA